MNKFDRILWRINGALLFVILIGALIFFWSDISQLLFPPPPRQPVPAVVRQEQGTHEKEALTFGDPVRVTGTPFLRLPLQSQGESDLTALPKGRSDRIYNYLYVDVTNLSSWLLFKNSDQLISRVYDLRIETAEQNRTTIATLLGVIGTDTNGDRRLTPDDRETMYYTWPDGRSPFEIISASDEILSVEQVPPDQVLVIYQRGQDTMGSIFSTQNGVRIRESVLAINGSR